MKKKEKLTKRALDRLEQELPEGDEVWDTDLPGYHVRGRRGWLALRVSYYNNARQRRVLTLGRYGTRTAAQARAAAKEALAIVAQGGDPRAVLEEDRAESERQQQQTLRAYLEGPYTAFQNRRKDGKGTLGRIARDFPDWLDKPMGKLTRADVERWQAKEEAADKPRAFQTLKRSYDALQALLAHAAERNVIPAHPLKGVRLQKPALTDEALAEQGTERRYLEPEEVDALFAGLEAYQETKRAQRRSSRAHGKAYLPDLDGVAYVDHVKPWVLAMFYTGFRPGDLFGLRWEHVNLTFGTIRKVVEKTAHHQPEPMTFPVCRPLVEILRAWHRQQGEPSGGLVFPSPVNNKRMAQTAMQRPWATVRKLGGLPEGLQLYTLRHNFASRLVMAGADILTVSKLMAHSSIETTIKFYAHLAPDHKRSAVDLFAQTVHKAPAEALEATTPEVTAHG
ncbi:tyrosine-type recombinase/integrase [Halomonas mongoliensis]|uniref:tyrosine-type recombinase/integrase n=1 Tax=Halomonas mongoliensis TaxID=321265 RepID=UPI00403A9604